MNRANTLGNLVYVCPDFSTVSRRLLPDGTTALSIGQPFPVQYADGTVNGIVADGTSNNADPTAMTHCQRTGTDCKCHCIRIHHLQIGKEQEESVYQRSIYRLQVL